MSRGDRAVLALLLVAGAGAFALSRSRGGFAASDGGSVPGGGGGGGSGGSSGGRVYGDAGGALVDGPVLGDGRKVVKRRTEGDGTIVETLRKADGSLTWHTVPPSDPTYTPREQRAYEACRAAGISGEAAMGVCVSRVAAGESFKAGGKPVRI